MILLYAIDTGIVIADTVEDALKLVVTDEEIGWHRLNGDEKMTIGKKVQTVDELAKELGRGFFTLKDLYVSSLGAEAQQ